MNAYAEMKKRYQEEVNALPIYWAFTEERFDEVLKELGHTKNDTDKLCRAPGGGFCLASDAKMIADKLIRHRKELEDLIRAWNGDERLPKKLVDVEAMTGRVEQLGGINLIWY